MQVAVVVHLPGLASLLLPRTVPAASPVTRSILAPVSAPVIATSATVIVLVLLVLTGGAAAVLTALELCHTENKVNAGTYGGEGDGRAANPLAAIGAKHDTRYTQNSRMTQDNHKTDRNRNAPARPCDTERHRHIKKRRHHSRQLGLSRQQQLTDLAP